MPFSATTEKALKIASTQPARPTFERPIFVGNHWFDEITNMVARFAGERFVAIVADTTLSKLYPQLLEQLSSTLPRSSTQLLPGGEQTKTLESFALLQQFMAENQVHRDDVVLSFGGGTIGDVVGFCAATYAHGMSWLNIPTTLTAQIDCAYGGYTALNIGYLKNYSGAFYWPDAVFVDTAFLDTLPAKEFNGALAEMGRLAMLTDAQLFGKLCAACTPEVGADGIRCDLMEFITRTIQAKACATEEDPYLHHLRVALRMGRTTSQALETASKLKLHHGDAVAIGLGFEAFLAYKLGLLPAPERKALVDLLENCQLPTVLPAELHDHLILDSMRMEKHNHGRDISLVLPYTPGKTLQDWPKPHVIMEPDKLWAHLTAYRLERG